jgi:hypothetical protein
MPSRIERAKPKQGQLRRPILTVGPTPAGAGAKILPTPITIYFTASINYFQVQPFILKQPQIFVIFASL